ncbi:MAG: hypothetical protein K2Q25_06715 [Mycobacteriaceae bacterium]|nr:hypothetical protein [Mycobacteriaceae bacterium]
MMAGLRRRDVVLVDGPQLAGVSGVVAALRGRLSWLTVVESSQLRPGDAPRGVVFVVSAAAVLAQSDCARLDVAAAATEVVIGVVAKIDAHRNWRDVRTADRAMLAAYATRYHQVPWVGVAAAPHLGPTRVDDLITTLRDQFADPDVDRRNSLRATEARLKALVQIYDRDVEGSVRWAAIAALRAQREAILRRRRASHSESALALRSQIQRTRIQLCYLADKQCLALRGELRHDTARLSRQNLSRFEAYARARIEETSTAVVRRADEQAVALRHALGCTGATSLAEEPSVADIPPPALRLRRLETRLVLLLGVGFGLGVALTVSRLLASLGSGLTVAGVTAGAAIGLAFALGMVRIRGVLYDRSVLDRWVGEATEALRSAMHYRVAICMVDLELTLRGALRQRQETHNVRIRDLISTIDGELRAQGSAAVRTAKLRDRESARLRAALAAVRVALGEPGLKKSTIRGRCGRSVR